MVLCKYQHIGTLLLFLLFLIVVQVQLSPILPHHLPPPQHIGTLLLFLLLFLIVVQVQLSPFLPHHLPPPPHIGTLHLENTNLPGHISTFKGILSAQRMIDKDFPERLNISYCRSVHVCVSSINYVIPIVFVFISVKRKSWGDGPYQGHPSQVTWVAACPIYPPVRPAPRVGEVFIIRNSDFCLQFVVPDN